MTSLHADLPALRAAATELGLLVHEFDRADDIAADAAAAVGSRTVNEALREFATNWNEHRTELLDSMQAVHSMISSSHDTFVAVDRDLAQQLRDACQPQAVTVPGGPR